MKKQTLLPDNPKLDEAHSHLNHLRDVKAPNLAVGRGADASTVYMLDFGFARRFL